MCDKVLSKGNFMLKFCLDKYRSQEMCNKAVAVFLPTLKFVPDLFVTSKMIKNLMLSYYVRMIQPMMMSVKILIMSHFLPMKCVCLA